MTTTSLTITRKKKDGSDKAPYVIEDALEKLRWRGTLPGASTWDRNAHALRALQGQGVDALSLLSLAMPSCWMVNARASSVQIQRWLTEKRAIDAWTVVFEILDFAMAPEEWMELSSDKRTALTSALLVLVTGPKADGASLAAVTKVLALLRPQIVPLMDDAALWFAIEAVDEPETADAPVATHDLFVPMLDWFAHQVIERDKDLVALAAAHDIAVLDGAQVLDRLLWVESWGERMRVRSAK